MGANYTAKMLLTVLILLYQLEKCANSLPISPSSSHMEGSGIQPMVTAKPSPWYCEWTKLTDPRRFMILAVMLLTSSIQPPQPNQEK